MISLMVAFLLVADPLASAPSEPATEEVKKPQKAKKICREDLSLTGSRMRKKVCLSEAEWAKRDQGRSAGDLRTIGAR